VFSPVSLLPQPVSEIDAARPRIITCENRFLFMGEILPLPDLIDQLAHH